MRALVRLLVSVALAALPVLAAAAPRTIADCERIEAADAYNRCLASFGPPARSIRLVPSEPLASNAEEATKADAEPAAPQGKKARHARRAGRHASMPRNEIRAKRMVFSVVSERSDER